MRTRPALFAGSWYPDAPRELLRLLDQALDCRGPAAGSARGGACRGLLLPHAGLAFSARLIAAGLSELPAATPLAVVVLAPSHYFSLEADRLYAGGYDALATPLGELAAWRPPDAERLFGEATEAVGREHAVEMALPCLAWRFRACRVLPLLCGPLSGLAAARRLAAVLADLARSVPDCLVVASSDLTHYGPRFGHQPFGAGYAASAAAVAARDGRALALLAAPDPAAFAARMAEVAPTMCGRHPALLLACLAEAMAWRGRVLGRYDSEQCLAARPDRWPDGDPPPTGAADYVGYGAVAYDAGELLHA